MFDAVCPPALSKVSLFCVGAARRRIWLSSDTVSSQEKINALFAANRAEPSPAPEAGVIVRFGGRDMPCVQAIYAGQALDLNDLVTGPEWKHFVLLPHPTRRIYANTLFDKGPAIEILEDELVVVQPEMWPLYVHMVLLWLLHKEGSLISIHSATAAIDAEALIMVGPSGAGKSTLSWALNQQGADVYGDEITFFTPAEYHLYPWRRAVCLRPGGVAELETPPDVVAWHEVKPNDPKCAVTLPEPSRPCPRHSASFIFMDGFAEKPSLTPMPGGLAVQRLLQGMGYGDPSIAARLDVAADLVNHFPCWRLAVGKPDETAALLAEYARGHS